MTRVWNAITALLCVGMIGGIVYGSGLIERPDADEIEAAQVEIAAGSLPFVCPGPAQLADGEWDRDPAYDPAPVGTTSHVDGVLLDPTGAVADGVQPLADGPARGWEQGPDAAVAQSGAGPAALWVRPDADGMITGAGVATSLTTSGDLRGLAAMSCPLPAVEQWLVGGSTVLGTSSRLVLQNPSRTPASVEIEVWGPTGRLELAGPATFSIPAGGQTATLLEGLAAEQRRLAIRVTSSGALVSAYVQVNELDGLRPIGVDFVGATSAPTKRQVITGLTVADSEIGDASGATLRLLAPTDTGSTARLTILGANGRMLVPGTEEVDLAGGAVTDVSLAGLPAGTYAVVVESDEPVVASGRAMRSAHGEGVTSPAPADFALVGAQGLRAEPGAEEVVALPSSMSAKLNLLAVPDVPRDVPAVGPGWSGTADAAADGTGADETATIEARVRLIDSAGKRIGDFPVNLAPGIVRTVSIAELAPDARASAVLVDIPAGSAHLSWSVQLQAGPSADELTSVVLPVHSLDTRTTMALRPASGFGAG